MQAAGLGQLDREAADTARPRVDQHPLPLPHPRQVQSLPGGGSGGGSSRWWTARCDSRRAFERGNWTAQGLAALLLQRCLQVSPVARCRQSPIAHLVCGEARQRQGGSLLKGE